MVVSVDAPAPDRASARAAIDRVSRASENVYLDAPLIAERLFGDAVQANVIVLGAAWQRGALPVSLGALREAFRLNGVSVERNLAAFEWGRAWVVDPELVHAATGEIAATSAPLSPQARELVAAVAPDDGELRRLLEVRIPDLVGWGGPQVASRYAAEIARVRAVETERIAGSTVFTEAVARGLYKLTAYKDEYEVARLHVEGLAALPRGARFRIHLHPPVLRALGMRRKIALGRWFVPALRLLHAGRRLRGTPLDPFGRTRVRRVERSLPGEYLGLVELALTQLSPATLEVAMEIAALPDLVRGYEEIKLAGVARFRERGDELAERLRALDTAAV
jgi:indolepyruvate ferredoxin oxidoreductase